MTTSRPLVVSPPQVHTNTVVSSDYGFVVGIAALSVLVHSGYMTARVIDARKKCVLVGRLWCQHWLLAGGTLRLERQHRSEARSTFSTCVRHRRD